jgi:hypothetical protein
MRRVGWLLLVLAACGDDPLTTPRRDSGVLAPDSGSTDPLAFQVGMRFKYEALLTYRTRNIGGTEKSARYELVLRIVEVDDRGPSGESTVTITATGAQTFAQNWDRTAGAHSWVSGAGPSDRDDQVSAAPTPVSLSRAPEEPPIQRQLPLGELYFLDLRKEEAIRTGFFERYQAIGPRFIAPDDEPRGRWVLALDGPDPSMEFYPESARKRRLSLAYDPKGWLSEISETLGDTTVENTPNASFTLRLVSGP